MPRVLLVEDESLIAMLAADSLNELGYDVVETASARAALEQINAGGEGFTFALVDVGLPDRPGEELTAEIKKIAPRLPIIIASGYGEQDLRSRFKSTEHLVFLTKPYHNDSLQAAIGALGLS
jgi:DNA-binding response OmpR family regulator